MVRVRAMRTLENAVRRWGFYRVAGCDEVGRGCLAGPVTAGAVILDPDRHIPGLADSKTITALERERLYIQITRRAIAWAVVSVAPGEIDEINIHRASLQAMRRAVMPTAPCRIWCWWTPSVFRICSSPSAGSRRETASAARS